MRLVTFPCIEQFRDAVKHDVLRATYAGSADDYHSLWFEQALTVALCHANRADVKRLGDVIKWMSQDVLKEESDTLEASGPTW